MKCKHCGKDIYQSRDWYHTASNQIACTIATPEDVRYTGFWGSSDGNKTLYIYSTTFISSTSHVLSVVIKPETPTSLLLKSLGFTDISHSPTGIVTMTREKAL